MRLRVNSWEFGRLQNRGSESRVEYGLKALRLKGPTALSEYTCCLDMQPLGRLRGMRCSL